MKLEIEFNARIFLPDLFDGGLFDVKKLEKILRKLHINMIGDNIFVEPDIEIVDVFVTKYERIKKDNIENRGVVESG